MSAPYLFEDVPDYLPVDFLDGHAGDTLVNPFGYFPSVHHLQKDPHSDAALLHSVLGEEVLQLDTVEFNADSHAYLFEEVFHLQRSKQRTLNWQNVHMYTNIYSHLEYI